MNNPPKILVVDDTPSSVLLLSRFLQQNGYAVLTARDGDQGYDMAMSERPDLILLDVIMPGKDGYEVCRMLKESSLTTEIPVIFVTARAETVDKIAGLDAGGVDYITKPFEPAEVMARVRTHLELKKVYEENLEYYKELLRSQKMASITTLAGGIAHNINNLMGAVMGYADMLHLRLDSDEKAKIYTDKILKASQRIADLTNNLLMYGRAARSAMTTVNLKEMLGKMVQLYGRVRPNGPQINLHIPPDIPDIKADRDQIFQALSNIFVNAWEATPPDGTITISISIGQLPDKIRRETSGSSVDGYAIISISDTGTGMHQGTAKRIFEPFFTTKKTVGVGLGLSAASGIIQKHDGVISVDTRLGEGSTFHVYLPLSREKSTTVNANVHLFEHIINVEDGSPIIGAPISDIPPSPSHKGWEK
jgi:two-component system sensor histidine kinase/response regulator